MESGASNLVQPARGVIFPIPSGDRGDSSGQTSPSNPLFTNLSMREIPSLYGLRGAAALPVLVYHYTLGHGRFADLFPGPFAVTLFFELSGLLITWLLLKEISQTGTLDRRQFYLRRALRLFLFFMWYGSYAGWQAHSPEVGLPSSTWAITTTP